MTPIYITLITEQPLIQTAVQTLLAQHDDLVLRSIIGISTNISTNIHHDNHRSPTPHPHVLLVTGEDNADHSLTQQLRSLLRTYPHAQLILLTDDKQDFCTDQLLATAVAGCIVRDEINASLVHLIRAVAAGEEIFTRTVVEKLVRQAQSTPIDHAALGLTEREGEVLRLILRGHTHPEIAEALHLTPQTVRNKATLIYGKIGVNSRGALMAWARQQQIDPG